MESRQSNIPGKTVHSMPIHRKLYPTFNNPEKWRKPWQKRFPGKFASENREKILQRNSNTCVYCGFKAEKYMMAHHINDDPNDYSIENLETICPMCNLILHSGQGVVIQGIVDLYEKSNFSQEDVIRITRQLRAMDKDDDFIIKKLGLANKVEFKQDIIYLKSLYGFISSRRSKEEMIRKSLDYTYQSYREQFELRFKAKNK